jgi:hypothetical protein
MRTAGGNLGLDVAANLFHEFWPRKR